jgi:hypothetical protein
MPCRLMPSASTPARWPGTKGAPIEQLEGSEIEWYLARDFIDSYLRTAFEAELKRRRGARPADLDEYEDEDASEAEDEIY